MYRRMRECRSEGDWQKAVRCGVVETEWRGDER